MSSPMNTSGNFDSFIYYATTAALAASFAIPILQLDLVAKSVLPPDRLRVRRRSEALHRLERSVSTAIQNNRERVCRKVGDKHTVEYAKKCTEYIYGQDEMKQLAKDLLAKDEYAEILAIEGDDEEEKSFARSTNEIYLYLSLKGGKRWVQVPLGPFCIVLADEFENILTTTALCFVADSSGGLGSRVLGELLQEPEVGVATVSEPSWMISLAFIMKKNLISKQSKLQKIIFSLCRLEAWRVRKDVGANRTVVFFLPGFSTTSTLLNLIHTTFPHERHVFCYDGCANSVKRATSKITQSNTSVTISPLYIPQSKMLNPKFAKLTSNQANAVEAWMSSVSTFLSIKDEKNHQYLPFVCRLGFLMGRTDGLGDTDLDTSKLAMSNILQHITGSRSRPLKDSIIDACFKMLKNLTDLEEKMEYPILSEVERLAIEDCVFCHKGILIGDKTLLDTVQPKKDWSLKAATKLTGCACCDPEEDEEDQDEIQLDDNFLASTNEKKSIDLSIPGAGFSMAQQNNRKPPMKSTSMPMYKDGKVGFAFDPNVFTGGKTLQTQNGKTPTRSSSVPTYKDGKVGFAFDPNVFTGGKTLQTQT